MAMEALKKNRDEDRSYNSEHVCIEPYEMPWLETVDVSVVRKKVEELKLEFFFTAAKKTTSHLSIHRM